VEQGLRSACAWRQASACMAEQPVACPQAQQPQVQPCRQRQAGAATKEPSPLPTNGPWGKHHCPSKLGNQGEHPTSRRTRLVPLTQVAARVAVPPPQPSVLSQTQSPYSQ